MAAVDIKRGTVEMLVASLLMKEDMYGYQLAQELGKKSRGLFTLQETSMYPSLYRLQERGLITAETRVVGRRRTRVYYHLNDAGKEFLKNARAEYLGLCRGILYVLDEDGPADELAE